MTISPNNPSGAVYAEAHLREVNALCREAGIYHISDETYEYFNYGTCPHFSPGSIPDAGAHTISLYSLSKAYGFASWRIGYMVVPQALFEPILKAQDTNLICPALISQYAAIGALQTGRAYCHDKISAIAQVRDIFNAALAPLPRCHTPGSGGAFYFLLRIETDMAPMALVCRLIDEHRVAAIPGNAFGLDQECCLRVAYGALDKETAAEGIERLVRGLKTIIN